MKVLTLVLLCAACGGIGDDVSSDAQAHRAYTSLDPAIDTALTLGFAGFNAAKSANIDPQTANGRKSGTITVTGQVDQGASKNKGMRLNVEFADYSDDGMISFSTTPDLLPTMTLSLKDIPTGTLDGVINGTVTMAGALTGDLTLSLTVAAQLEEIPGQTGQVERKPNTTTVSGTATSASGTYTVSIAGS